MNSPATIDNSSVSFICCDGHSSGIWMHVKISSSLKSLRINILSSVTMIVKVRVNVELMGVPGLIHHKIGGYQHEVGKLVSLCIKSFLTYVINQSSKSYILGVNFTCSRDQNLVFLFNLMSIRKSLS